MNIHSKEILTRISEIEAQEIPIQDISSISANTDFIEIMSVIVDKDLAILNVKNEKDTNIGFITLLDILKIFEPKHSDIHSVLSRKQILSETKAEHIAKTQLPLIYDDTKLEQIAELMLKYESSFLPRAKNKKNPECLGIILLKDIFVKCNEILKSYLNEIGADNIGNFS